MLTKVGQQMLKKLDQQLFKNVGQQMLTKLGQQMLTKIDRQMLRKLGQQMLRKLGRQLFHTIATDARLAGAHPQMFLTYKIDYVTPGRFFCLSQDRPLYHYSEIWTTSPLYSKGLCLDKRDRHAGRQ